MRELRPHGTEKSIASSLGETGAGDPVTGRVLGRLRTPVWVFDIERARVAWANEAALEVWKARDLGELRGRDMSADMSPSVKARLEQYRRDFERADTQFAEVWTLYPGGVPTTLRVIFSGHRLQDGRMAMLCEALAEVTDTPERLRSAEALMHTPVMITLYDVEERVLYRNPAARGSWGEGRGGFADRLIDRRDLDQLRDRLERNGRAEMVVRVRTAEGVRWHEIAARRCLDAVSGKPALLVSETDVTAHKTAEAQVRYFAEHDTLTGLANRSALQVEVERRIERARAAGRQIGLLFVDLDRFKTINDSLGHAIGDALLIEMAHRLSSTVSAEDFVARLGGDEFLVCLDLTRGEGRATRAARRILAEMERPFRFDGHELTTSASVGISFFPRDGEDIDTLLRHADLAMYAAKEQGRNRWVGYKAAMKADVDAQLALDSALRRALDQGEFEIYYQPRLSIEDERIIGAEALLRWHHPTRGLVMPGAFIPFAEKTGLIDRIGACVLRDAAQQQRLWADAGHDLSISVNLSARQFRDPRLTGVVADIIEETGCNPRKMQIEITESMLIGEDQTSSATLEALTGFGFSIAIDDFGTGYSNLGTIRRHPIDTLKIDRSFVATLETRPALAELIIGMCRLLEMRIVAEGVETEAQLDWLKARNCHEYQGYLFSPAVPVDTFDELLRRQALLISEGGVPLRSPLWDLVPLVDRPGDVDWRGPEAGGGKVHRLRTNGVLDGFIRRSIG